MPKQSITPCLRYVDAPAAIDFLCNAFGFERHAVFADQDDPTLIHHAQLRLGDSLIMLSSARPGEGADGYRWKTPTEAGGITVCICCVVADADMHFVQARTAGADIVTEPHDNLGYPGRSYNVRDIEGNNWDFGTYDPWA
jgi:uncharacterized glyoxalase superfamily protein PhnB